MLTGFRFRKQINVLPWLTFNISKTGLSASVGPKNAHITVGRGGTYVYMDIPGSGTYFRRKLGPLMEDVGAKEPETKTTEETEPEKEKVVETTILYRLIGPGDENAFLDAAQALREGDHDTAYEKAKKAATLGDGAFLAGLLAMKHEAWQPAADYLEAALDMHERLGKLSEHFGLTIQVYVPLNNEFVVLVEPRRRDCLLLIADVQTRLQNNERAIQCLHELREHYDPDDLIVRLMLAELYDTEYGDNPRVQHEIVSLAESIENDSPLHAALMYYRAKALRRLGVLVGARDTLTKALRKKKDYPADLLAALRYERALLYEQEGQTNRAREELEKVYAVAPDHEDVAERLGLKAKVSQLPPVGVRDESKINDQTAGGDSIKVDVSIE